MSGADFRINQRLNDAIIDYTLRMEFVEEIQNILVKTH